MTNEDYLKVAVYAAKQSEKLFTQFFGKPKSVKMKNGDPRDLVTEIDKKIETQIRKIILKNFPSHKIIGEELGSQELEKNDLVWILDPIDGTTNYIQGVPICCISIALWDSKGPLVAVVYNPIINYFFTAQRGKGAFLNGKKIKVSKRSSLGQAFGGFGWGRNIPKAQINFPKLVKLLNKIRTLGSSTLEMCFVGLGVFDFHIQSELNIWDFAASALIIMEAKGKITQLDGKPITKQSKSIISSNGKLQNKLVAEIKKSFVI